MNRANKNTTATNPNVGRSQIGIIILTRPSPCGGGGGGEAREGRGSRPTSISRLVPDTSGEGSDKEIQKATLPPPRQLDGGDRRSGQPGPEWGNEEEEEEEMKGHANLVVVVAAAAYNNFNRRR